MDLYFFGFVILVAGATWFLRKFQNGGDRNDQIDQVPDNIGKYHLTSYRINLLIFFLSGLARSRRQAAERLEIPPFLSTRRYYRNTANTAFEKDLHQL